MENKVSFLLDTNVWLERMLEQEQTGIVNSLLSSIPSQLLFISDFSLHSIGVILNRMNKIEVFDAFLIDLFSYGNVTCLNTDPLDNIDVIKSIIEKGFDYDDAYQEKVASKYNLLLVTFDKDFKKKGVKFLSPHEAIEKYNTSIK
jgi:predicted nucleic acid-binding protein